MPDLIEVTIDSVRVSLMSPQRIVILREKNGERYLPIWVGPYEAESITIALQEVEHVRPLTHDLLKNLFTTFNALLVRVEIQSLKEDIYYGNIVAELDGQTINIDSRSSDAIALAVRAHIPIMVYRSVMDQAAILPENDIQAEAGTPADGTSEPEEKITDVPPSEEEEERLSIFDDFLNKLDQDGKKDETGPDVSTPS